MSNNVEKYEPSMKVRDISKNYLGVDVLHAATFDVMPNKLTVIGGMSGSGKTTLLNMMSSIDTPSSGSIYVDRQDITAFDSDERREYRAGNGQIFQRSGLLSGLTAEENIRTPHDLIGNIIDERWLDYLVDKLAISAIMKRSSAKISGGQAQRVGIARALAHRPKRLFADEPTASLDAASTYDVHHALKSVTQEGTTVVMVSHDEESQNYADRTIQLVDGKVRIIHDRN